LRASAHPGQRVSAGLAVDAAAVNCVDQGALSPPRAFLEVASTRVGCPVSEKLIHSALRGCCTLAAGFSSVQMLGGMHGSSDEVSCHTV
jgi:hypothetical protein